MGESRHGGRQPRAAPRYQLDGRRRADVTGASRAASPEGQLRQRPMRTGRLTHIDTLAASFDQPRRKAHRCDGGFRRPDTRQLGTAGNLVPTLQQELASFDPFALQHHRRHHVSKPLPHPRLSSLPPWPAFFSHTLPPLSVVRLRVQVPSHRLYRTTSRHQSTTIAAMPL